MTNTPPVLVDATKSVVVARLDDGGPNAIGFDAIEGLTTAIEQASDAGMPLVILGRDGMFSAGFDLKVFQAGLEQFTELVTEGAELLKRMVEAPVPIVIGAAGHAVAMGSLLLLAADYRMGADGGAGKPIKIGLNEVSISMTLPHFAVTLAESRLSKRHFVRATMLSELHQPAGACDVGFLDEVVSAAELEAATVAKAEAFSELPRGAFSGTKARARGGLAAALADAIERDKADFEVGSS